MLTEYEAIRIWISGNDCYSNRFWRFAGLLSGVMKTVKRTALKIVKSGKQISFRNERATIVFVFERGQWQYRSIKLIGDFRDDTTYIEAEKILALAKGYEGRSQAIRDCVASLERACEF